MTHPPPPADAAALADDLARARLVPADRLAALLADFPGGGPADLAVFLVDRGALTRFQADRALAGAARSLVLGPYRVTGPHRPGALGPVLAAEKTGRGAAGPVALAAVPLRSLWRAKQARELARRVAAVRPHPAVVPLADADSANGFHYLAWPLAHGDRLAERVAAAGPLPPPKVAAVLAQLAAGLAACHAAGLAHGLLSPAAVALPAGGAPARVLDFGAGVVLAGDLAGSEPLLDTLTGSAALARFLPYAAPEWVAAPAAPTPAADQYSLGAVGYFALTGRPPAPGGDAPAAVPGVPAELAAALDRLMAADPAARFTGMDEAHAALAAAGAADPDDLVEPPSVPIGPQPTAGTSAGGAVSWAAPTRPPDRDDSEDSIRFDLPEATDPGDWAAPAPAAPRAPVPAPALAPARPAPRPVAKSATAAVRPAVVLPPRLPAAPLAGTAPAPALTATAPPPRPPATTPTPPPDPPPTGSGVWQRVRRKMQFWKPPADPVRVQVYGPPAAARSEAPRLTVFLFQPAAAGSIATLARAFDHAAVLLGECNLTAEIPRGEELAVHLAVAGAAVTTPVRAVEWVGGSCRAEFELVVPWQAAAGPAAGVVSVGRAGVLAGAAAFRLVVTAARG